MANAEINSRRIACNIYRAYPPVHAALTESRYLAVFALRKHVRRYEFAALIAVYYTRYGDAKEREKESRERNSIECISYSAVKSSRDATCGAILDTNKFSTEKRNCKKGYSFIEI